MKIAIAFLTTEIQKGTLEFAELIAEKLSKENLQDYNREVDVFIISDSEHEAPITKQVKVVKLADDLCISAGYFRSNIDKNSTHIAKDPIAYDKAMYYFCELDPKYDILWVFEDDVFIPFWQVLNELIDRYMKCDLVTANNFLKEDSILDWHWRHIFDKIDPPYYYSMVCAAMFSRKMLDAVKEYRNKRGHLFYIEVMFNTLAAHNNLKVKDAFELKSIVWKGKWELAEFMHLPNNIFHPIKDIESHEQLRRSIAANLTTAKDWFQHDLPSFITNHPEFKK
jgi:hypothetical protein